MTMSVQSTVTTHTANGASKAFAFNFKVVSANDLFVYFNGIQQTSGFTVSGYGYSSGGNVTFTVAPPDGTVVRLQRRVALDRTTDYINGGPLDAEVMDADFDRTIMMLQDLNTISFKEVSDGTFDVGNRRMKNVADPVEAHDAITKGYHDAQYVPQITAIQNAAAASALAAATSQSAAASSASSASASASSAASSATIATAAADRITPYAGSAQVGGNLSFTSIGQRIIGDFSNSIASSRVLFQTSIANSSTNVGAIPNGTGYASQFTAFSSADAENSSLAQLAVTGGSTVMLISGIRGTGAYLPLAFYAGGSERMRITTTGDVAIGTVTPTAGARWIGIANTDAGSASLAGFQAGSNNGNLYAFSSSTSSGGGSTIYTDCTAGAFTIKSHAAIPLIFGTSNVERMRINPVGEVSLTNNMHIAMQGSGAGVWLSTTSSADRYFVGTDFADSFRIYDSQGSANRLVIDTAGRVTITTMFQFSGGTPGVGKILTSDAIGQARWETLTLPPQYVKAFCDWRDTGGTGSLYKGINIASVTRSESPYTLSFTFTFSTPMANNTYGVLMTLPDASPSDGLGWGVTKTTTSIRFTSSERDEQDPPDFTNDSFIFEILG
ncbi:phage tail fiber protein [Uliginosibacterium sp. 31-16]|uniref:phage tail fiber domain-containing protein n=1 Tax=Uliginosibacterium sp. 31-16 TaxID=3068315 RepID=UPI00273D625A|nr:phage tail fiber protein [Uliginosibacterium sp. 31-16]MDP5239935.1 phage tail fiber protein [Uliginosibacterium sp. 31-16]